MKRILIILTLLIPVVISQVCPGEISNGNADTKITVLIPSGGEKASRIAGDIFIDMWQKVTDRSPDFNLIRSDKPEFAGNNFILIGSDAVNPVVHELIRSGAIEGLNLVYGGDNYRILSVAKDDNRYLILAGGNGLSTIFAVYDFFRKQAGAEYFWDGDIIPKKDDIQLTGLNFYENPRFSYRGLRYFAHRSLHRFQAEHWDLDDWKKEIDWLLKERFNFFMLRTGIDDLFQRAFPGDVPYPPTDRQDPDAQQRSYNDRTSFWQLKYRGELRKQVLQYARDRGLFHPEDIGTITHWYSHTPSSFYKSFPDFPVIKDQKTGYSLPTQAIWDIQDQRSWDAYWRLTETHIKEFGGGSPRMFHTIGMAERTFGASDRDNLQSKLYVYRKTQQKLREHYPDIPLFIASWDFIGWRWKDQDVQNLMKEFDPERTILLDYTADKNDKATYRDWDVYKKFPWIFGIFHSLEKNSDIHEDYDILTPRLKEVADDPKCLGLTMWTENSHTDTYLLEYLADNSWRPGRLEPEQATERFCKARYASGISNEMISLWNSFLNVSQTMHWGLTGIVFSEPQFRMLTSGTYINLTPGQLSDLGNEYKKLYAGLTTAPEVLRGLARLSAENYDNYMWKRDVLDMARTIASRAYFTSMMKGSFQMEGWRVSNLSRSEIRKTSKLSRELLTCLGDILAMSDDFSMNASFLRLSEAKELNGVKPLLNPHTELTLKGNAENGYCRSHQYELVKYVYGPELNAYWAYVFKKISSGDRSQWKMPAEFGDQYKVIADKFYNTPLSAMAPALPRNPAKLEEILLRMEKLVNELLLQNPETITNFNIKN